MEIKSRVFNINGMHCTACAQRIEKQLIGIVGVTEAAVNFSSGTAVVYFNSHDINDKEIVKEAKLLGIDISLQYGNIINEPSLRPLLAKAVAAWGVTLVLMIFMYAPVFTHSHRNPIFSFISLILVGIAIFIPGKDILVGAKRSIQSQIMSMDVLIALGAIVSWISSILSAIGFPIQDYSITAVMLIAVNMTGHLIETIARGKASQAVMKLVDIQCKTAQRQISEIHTEEIPVSELKIGDLIHVKAGDKIPADGIIISGNTSTDESFLTGESLPVSKEKGDNVYSASINLDGFIIVQVTKLVSQSLLSQTVKLVQEAQGTKVPIQILADKITCYFVPIILLISFLTFAIWFSFPNLIPNMLWHLGIDYTAADRLSAAVSAAVSVLVIACPCALGLATPMALVNGSALGARRGILLRRGSAIQSLTKAQIIAFDKTGTLTLGKPRVLHIYTDSVSEKEAIGIMAGVELLSNHPLAQAIINYANENNIVPVSVHNSTISPGQGIHGHFNDKDWFVGSLKATDDFEIQISNQLRLKALQSMDKGETLLCLSDMNQKKCIAVASCADKLKPEAVSAMKTLKKMGLKTIIITGDHKHAAMNIAQQLDIKSVMYETSPKQKLETVVSLQKQGYQVCFVGDGINDAAALEMSDVGVAIGSGTDIASEAGDIILVSGSLTSLVSSIKLAKATFRKIEQNLFWAFFYNVIAIPIAFSGVLHPIAAEVAMSLSSLTVILNSMLLARTNI